MIAEIFQFETHFKEIHGKFGISKVLIIVITSK